MIGPRTTLVLLTLLTMGAGGPGRPTAPDRFDHVRHARLFPSCVSCHRGAIDSTVAMLPAATVCASCHDGQVERRVEWAPRTGPRPSNLHFKHALHPHGEDCASCHVDQGQARMQVHAAEPTSCFACHGTRAPHLAQADTLCASCHLPLTAAVALTDSAIARFPAPPSHAAPGFGSGGGHAGAARQGDRSCATCHAREFCAECHAASQWLPSIVALGSDPRAAVITVATRLPATHARSDFDRAHARLATRRIESCASCHTQATCTSCHLTAPSVAAALDTLPVLVTARHAPPSTHAAASWRSTHGALASARPQNCATCHARSECLECHRPDAARPSGSFHPAGFLVSHPAQAYSRGTACADCHNTQAFCQDCHRQAGVVASERLRGGFHDAKAGFALGHGQAARQSLESCVSCHAERDCLTCHSATRGRGFDPHGPGFDGERLKRKNPGLCAACHAPGSV